MKLLISIGVLLVTAFAVGMVQADSPWPFNAARTISVQSLDGGSIQLIPAERLMASFSTPETRNETPTEGSSRRLYVIDNPAYDVVDAACFPFHGEADIVPLARKLSDGSVIVVNALVVSGSDAICGALGLKTR